jgi:hypothetical protein
VADDPSLRPIWRLRLRSPAYYAILGTFVMLLLALFAACAGAILGLVVSPGNGAWFGLVTGVLVPLAWGGWMWPQKLALGSDGVLVSSWWRTWIIPFESIASASFDAAVWCLVVSGGKQLRFQTDWTEDEQNSVSHSFEAARAAHRLQQRDPVDLDAWLGRAGRSTDVWVQGLRRLLAQAAPGYRSAEPDRETLREVLMRGTAPPQQRVAAAVALCANGVDDSEHVRVASDATVQPELAKAFRVIAMDAGDEEVGRTLEALEKAKLDGG